MKARRSLIKQRQRSPVNSGGATEKWTKMIETQENQTMETKSGLTEKEVCINMWKHIKEHIRYNHSKDEPIGLRSIKYDYLKEYNMESKWLFMCILCQKHHKVCTRCPLGSCSSEYKTPWAVVTDSTWDCETGTYISPFTLEERLEACDKIIEAIEKDIPDDYKS